MIKHMITAGALLTCLAATPVLAQAPASHTWTGGYIGVNGGFGGDKFSYPVSGTASSSSEETMSTSSSTNVGFAGEGHITSSGFVGGVQLGYNHLNANNWLVGVEADIDSSAVKGEIGASGGGSATGSSSGSLDISATAHSRLDYLGTVRLRVGRVLNNGLLVYGTAGAAYGNVKSRAEIAVGGSASLSGALSKSATRSGWAAGVGAEYPLSDRWTMRTEYLYADLGKYTLIEQSGSILGISGNIKAQAETRVHIVRVAFNYKFG